MKTQVSGSLSLDMSGLAEGIAGQLAPDLDRMHDSLSRLIGLVTSAALEDQEVVRVLRHALINMGGQEQPETMAQAGYLAQYLTDHGYALVRVRPEEVAGGPVSPPPVGTVTQSEPAFWSGGE